MQHQAEQLSALVDDELDGPPGALLARLVEDEASRGQWARYHLIGDVLRDQEAPLAPDLRARISAAIEAEPALLAPAAVRLAPAPHLPAAGNARRWGIAASLAAVGLTGVMLVARAPDSSPGMPLAQTPLVQPTVPSAPVAQAQVVSWDEGGALSAATPETVEFQRRLNSYLVNFNEQRANLGVPSVHPYVRIVGFESEPER